MSQILRLTEGLRQGVRPDLQALSEWLSKQEIPYDEWDDLADALCTAYGYADEIELASHISKPKFTRVSEYTDDFTPLLDEIQLGGWLRDYVEHTRGMEAPTPFHFATGMTVLGACLKRQVFVDQGYYQIWPAVQAMLVGPSGRVKKSTAAGYGVDLALQLTEGLFNLLPDAGSGEALITELSQIARKSGESTGLLYVSEMATFLGKQEYNINLIQNLTDIFDCRLSKRKRTGARGNEAMKNIAVSALFCTNEDWAIDAIPSSAFGGGFMRRVLLFYQGGTDRVFPRPQKPTAESIARLHDGLMNTKFVKGEAKLVGDGEPEFDRIYRRIKREWPEDERMVPFWDTLSDHVLRLALLISVSDDLKQRDSIDITPRHLTQAYAILQWVARYLPAIYSQLGGNEFGADHTRIHNIIKRAGGVIEDRELGRRMAHRLSRKRLEEHLETMRLNGVIVKERVNPWEGQYGWKLVRKT